MKGEERICRMSDREKETIIRTRFKMDKLEMGDVLKDYGSHLKRIMKRREAVKLYGKCKTQSRL